MAFIASLSAATVGCSDRRPPVAPRDLNLAPTASITVAGLPCSGVRQLTASATDPDGGIVRYEWDFEDDGAIDTAGTALAAVEHTYGIGNHRVKVIVTDDRGAFGIAVANIAVTAPVEPDTLYVSSTTGSPSGTGTRSDPYARVSDVSLEGGCGGRTVLVAVGSYSEAITLGSGLTLRGGFDPATWQRIPGVRTRIWSGTSPAEADAARNTEVSDIDFVAADDINLRGASSIAMVIRNSDGSLVFTNCGFNAGPGVNGSHSSDGPWGAPGADGRPASQGGQGGGALGAEPLSGGRGGVYQIPTLLAGMDGSTSACGTLGGTGGAAGVNGCPLVIGADGLPGSDEPHGSNGTGFTPGTFEGTEWKPGRGNSGSGTCLQGGGGGGGGGAGGGCPPETSPMGGGGGGQGGRSGGGGVGGDGGGGSFAVILHDSSPRFVDCSWTARAGGNGGDGGDGGYGGPGGAGGAGGVSGGVRVGGNGGRGGRGGNGGGGSGGPGGPSWCIVRLGGSNPTLVSPTFTVGVGGTGGLGGLRGDIGPRADSGPDGPAGVFGP